MAWFQKKVSRRPLVPGHDGVGPYCTWHLPGALELQCLGAWSQGSLAPLYQLEMIEWSLERLCGPRPEDLVCSPLHAYRDCH